MSSTNGTDKKIVLITGGSSGLGRISAKYILAEGNTVIITGRSKARLDKAVKWIKPTQEQNTRLHLLILDLDNLESIRNAVESYKTLNLPAVDVLINNAGSTYTTLQYSSETSIVEKTFFTNIVGPWYFTMLLKPHLSKEGRILFTTSALHDPEFKVPLNQYAVEYVTATNYFENLDGKQSYNGLGFYKASKLAMMWIAYLFVNQFPDMTIITLEPGFIPTTELMSEQPWIVRSLFRYIMIHINPAYTTEGTCATWYREYATSPDFKDATGKYFFSGKEIKSSERSYNMVEATRFWNIVCDICNTPEHRF